MKRWYRYLAIIRRSTSCRLRLTGSGGSRLGAWGGRNGFRSLECPFFSALFFLRGARQVVIRYVIVVESSAEISLVAPLSPESDMEPNNRANARVSSENVNLSKASQ